MVKPAKNHNIEKHNVTIPKLWQLSLFRIQNEPAATILCPLFHDP